MAPWETTPPLSILEETLSNPSTPIGKRMRAAYYLRQYHSTTEPDDDAAVVVVSILTSVLQQRQHGSLMRHEFAYVLGQLREPAAVPVLESIVRDSTDCVMVRHEAAEALGAIGGGREALQEIITTEKGGQVEPIELVETCRLALALLDWRRDNSTGEEDTPTTAAPVICACQNPYGTVDPAPPDPAHDNMSSEELGTMLRNNELPMFERYRALFTLRHRRATDVLTGTLVGDTSSALLRHEVAYVLGQLQDPSSVPALAESLGRTEEHFMVRHESAEALGAILDSKRVEDILRGYLQDPDVVVRESCEVALDAVDYWGGGSSSLDDHTVIEGNDAFAVLKANSEVQSTV